MNEPNKARLTDVTEEEAKFLREHRGELNVPYLYSYQEGYFADAADVRAWRSAREIR